MTKIYSEVSGCAEQQISHNWRENQLNSWGKYPQWSTERHKVGKHSCREIKTKVNKLDKNPNPIVCCFK